MFGQFLFDFNIIIIVIDYFEGCKEDRKDVQENYVENKEKYEVERRK